MADIRLGRIDQTTKDKFDTLSNQAGFEGRRKDQTFLQALLERWEKSDAGETDRVDRVPTSELTALSPDAVLALLHLSDIEYQEITEALEHSYGSFDELLRVSLLTEARRTKRQAVELEDRTLEVPEQRARVRGAGYAYVETVVRQLMSDNLQATTPMERVYITRGRVADMTGTNRADINRYFDNHRDMLEQHHKQIGFETAEHGISHNRHRAQYLKRKSLGEVEK